MLGFSILILRHGFAKTILMPPESSAVIASAH